MKFNYKLYFRQQLIGLILLIILFLFVISVIIYTINRLYPTFKYTSLFSYILCTCVILISVGVLWVLVKRVDLTKFRLASKTKKLKYSFVVLLCVLSFITSIEYILYLSNRDNISIEKEVFEQYIQDDIDNINNHIIQNEQYKGIYNTILNNLNENQLYKCLYDGQKYLIVINNDSIQIRLHRKAGMPPHTHIRRNSKEYDFFGVRECGISISNERYDISHPSSRIIVENIINNDSVVGSNLRSLIEQKIQYYDARIKHFHHIIEYDKHISFGTFLINSLINQGRIGDKSNLFIQILIVIQAIIITFASGYIYQIIYKILDGEN